MRIFYFWEDSVVKIHSIQSYRGRNIYTHKPVIRIVFDIGELEGVETRDLGDFNDRLLKLLPGLSKHHCSRGREGGFVERLREGTYIGHVTEHVILELEYLLNYDVFYGRTRFLREPSVYYMVYEYINERCGIECGKAGFYIVRKLLAGESIDLDAVMANLARIRTESELGPSTKALYDEAVRRGIPVTRVGEDSILQLGYGRYQRRIEASLTDTTACISADVVGNKHLTKRLLADFNIPVPRGDIAYSVESAVMTAEEIGYPVVVKPFDGNQGKGVTLNITDERQLRIACAEALRHSKAVIVERYIKGKDYRILVVGGKVSAVAERRPPFVVGDGIHTVRELVDIENRNPLRGDDHEKPLTKIRIDDVAKQLLARRNMDENHVPAEGEIIYLRENGNLSTGGTARDCTEEIHPYNAELAVRAARITGLDIAGIDMTAEDISRPIDESNGAILEVNAAPGLRMHLYPSEGKRRNVAGDILDMLFPEGRPFTIPIVSVTGTNGKTTVTRLIGYALTLRGMKVGMTTTAGIYIGDECILEGDNTGPVSAATVLSDREIDAAVLETARGGIVKRGLGYDLADVGVITNIGDDHLGLDGVETLEDLAFVKALVIEAVKPEGYAVLNADDPMTPYFLERVKSRVILFSRSGKGDLLERHVKSGGPAVYSNGSHIMLFDGKKSAEIIKLEDVPITFGGILDCNIENSLAATAALYGLKVPARIIRMALRSFKPDNKTNPGRFNVFDLGDFRVMLDYAHNSAGYREVAKLASSMGAKRLVGVVGMPGDRLDRNITEVGEICAKTFSRIYIKEDRDPRGRKPGEVAALLYNAIAGAGFKKENIYIIRDEVKALEAAIVGARAGDLVVMLYEEFGPAFELVQKYRREMERSLISEIAVGDVGTLR